MFYQSQFKIILPLEIRMGQNIEVAGPGALGGSKAIYYIGIHRYYKYQMVVRYPDNHFARGFKCSFWQPSNECPLKPMCNDLSPISKQETVKYGIIHLQNSFFLWICFALLCYEMGFQWLIPWLNIVYYVHQKENSRARGCRWEWKTLVISPWSLTIQSFRDEQDQSHASL